MPLANRLLASIRAHPDAVAVVQGNERYSYAELGRMIATIARYLRESGLTTGDRAALLMTNSFAYTATFYGIWCAGGITVALNTQAKAEEIGNWLSHARARWLFADANHPELAELRQATTSQMEIIPVPQGRSDPPTAHDLWHSDIHGEIDPPAITLQASDPASIIYTSGTTGEPKGVTLSHGNLETNVDSILEYLHLGPTDSIVNVLPFYYSYGNSILHTHLAVGAKLILENSLLYPHRVVERLAGESATGFSGVPSTFNLLLGRVKLEDFDLSSLRYLTQAGGPMPPVVADRLLRALPWIELYIMYGQTEATARLSYLPPADLHRKRGSIGVAIPGVALEVRDKSGAPVKIGETGEICAKGPNIMQGYWRDPEKTAQVIKDGWLYTGDLAHIDDEGYLFIDGRSSEMIKSGGNRISPKAIEEVIQELDGVGEVAVIGVPDEMLGEVIKAFVVAKETGVLDKKTVQHHCKSRLALYKIPKFIDFIEALPKTASGKIQRFLLH